MDEGFKERFGWISEWIRNEINIVSEKKGIMSRMIKSFWNSDT